MGEELVVLLPSVAVPAHWQRKDEAHNQESWKRSEEHEDEINF